jgi:hypothetical protein
MATIEDVVRAIDRDLAPQFEERLRADLVDRDPAWLVDQIVRLVLAAHGLEDRDRRDEAEAKARSRAERFERVRELGLDEGGIRSFLAEHDGVTRERLVDTGHLHPTAPGKGGVLLTADDRTSEGDRLLMRAKDVLFALLFGDPSTNTNLHRSQQELLTLALPRHKAAALDFMRASTELAAAGTWQDPENVASDERAANVLLEVQFGDTAEELVGRAVIVCLSLVNNLEVNEQVLYARMINVEESTLIV